MKKIGFGRQCCRLKKKKINQKVKDQFSSVKINEIPPKTISPPQTTTRKIKII